MLFLVYPTMSDVIMRTPKILNFLKVSALGQVTPHMIANNKCYISK